MRLRTSRIASVLALVLASLALYSPDVGATNPPSGGDGSSTRGPGASNGSGSASAPLLGIFDELGLEIPADVVSSVEAEFCAALPPTDRGRMCVPLAVRSLFLSDYLRSDGGDRSELVSQRRNNFGCDYTVTIDTGGKAGIVMFADGDFPTEMVFPNGRQHSPGDGIGITGFAGPDGIYTFIWSGSSYPEVPDVKISLNGNSLDLQPVPVCENRESIKLAEVYLRFIVEHPQINSAGGTNPGGTPGTTVSAGSSNPNNPNTP